MKILITGRYETDYNRTLIILAGLRNLGIQLVEFPYKRKTFNVGRELRKYDEEVDFIFLPSFTHLDVFFVKRHTKKPLIFDPLISRYMSKVFDYRKVWRYSIRSLKNYLKDFIMMKTADIVIADTNQHLEYYNKIIGIEKEKIKIIPVGVNIEDFFPKKNDTFLSTEIMRVGFYGSYIPLHGIDKIIEAARLLENTQNIEFELVGDGVTKKTIIKDLKNRPVQKVTLKGKIEYQNLNNKINTFDICLGIFGNSIKTNSVVPNKVFHYAACGKCIITKNTDAIKEVFTDGVNIVLTNGSPQDIASKIKLLQENQELRKRIGDNALELMKSSYNQNIIANKLIDICKNFDY